MNLARRSPLQLVIGALLVIGSLAAAAGLAYLFLRGAAPPAVGLGSPSPDGP